MLEGGTTGVLRPVGRQEPCGAAPWPCRPPDRSQKTPRKAHLLLLGAGPSWSGGTLASHRGGLSMSPGSCQQGPGVTMASFQGGTPHDPKVTLKLSWCEPWDPPPARCWGQPQDPAGMAPGSSYISPGTMLRSALGLLRCKAEDKPGTPSGQCRSHSLGHAKTRLCAMPGSTLGHPGDIASLTLGSC